MFIKYLQKINIVTFLNPTVAAYNNCLETTKTNFTLKYNKIDAFVEQNPNPNPSFTSLRIQNTKILCHRTAYECRYPSVSKPKEAIDNSAKMSWTDALKENPRAKLTFPSAQSTIIYLPTIQQLITI